jgi:predicted nucleotidyltransferase
MGLVKLTAKKLSQKEVDSIVTGFLNELKELPEVEEIILFGSAARGEMSEASDVDFVAIFPAKAGARVGSKQFHKNRKNFWPVDVLFVDREHFESRSQLGGVFFVAREEGKILFRRGNDPKV